MLIYLVTVNGQVSNEAYKTLEEAQDYIIRRTGYEHKKPGPMGYLSVELNGSLYRIQDVRVKV